MERLEKLRTVTGQPIIIASGARCDFWNRMIGGEPDSAHLTGEAADLACETTGNAYRLMQGAIPLFRRVGYGRRDRDLTLTFHVDISLTHPQGVLWTY